MALNLFCSSSGASSANKPTNASRSGGFSKTLLVVVAYGATGIRIPLDFMGVDADAALLGELDGVCQQIGKHLAQSMCVSPIAPLT